MRVWRGCGAGIQPPANPDALSGQPHRHQPCNCGGRSGFLWLTTRTVLWALTACRQVCNYLTPRTPYCPVNTVLRLQQLPIAQQSTLLQAGLWIVVCFLVVYEFAVPWTDASEPPGPMVPECLSADRASFPKNQSCCTVQRCPSH